MYTWIALTSVLLEAVSGCAPGTSPKTPGAASAADTCPACDTAGGGTTGADSGSPADTSGRTDDTAVSDTDDTALPDTGTSSAETGETGGTETGGTASGDTGIPPGDTATGDRGADTSAAGPDSGGDETGVAPATETACLDGLDDDGDGAVDCDDTDCVADAACVATCGATDLGSATGPAVATGSTTGAGDDFRSSCSRRTASPEDAAFSWTAPADGTYTISTDGSGYDTVLSIWSADCITETTCDDDGGSGTSSLVTITAVAGESFLFVVDGYDRGGSYELNIYAGAESACGDGLDDDGDGYVDCDDDDCASGATCGTETDCSDALDDDADGATDCDDTDCASTVACVAPCAAGDLGAAVGTVIAADDTAGAGDDDAPSCAGVAGGEDEAWLWTAPASATYTFTAEGAGLSLSAVATCGGAELGCGGPSDASLVLTLAEGDAVVLSVDAGDGDGGYALAITPDREVDCADGTDDDGDARIDCLDSDCDAASACDRTLADFDLGSSTGISIASGTTAAASDDWSPTCGSGSAGDIAYSWVAPSAGAWTFDLSGSSFDTVLEVAAPDGEEAACDDDGGGTTSASTVTVEAGALVIVIIDGYGSSEGAYSLSIL